jgi:hypothetical protein
VRAVGNGVVAHLLQHVLDGNNIFLGMCGGNVCGWLRGVAAAGVHRAGCWDLHLGVLSFAMRRMLGRVGCHAGKTINANAPSAKNWNSLDFLQKMHTHATRARKFPVKHIALECLTESIALIENGVIDMNGHLCVDLSQSAPLFPRFFSLYS